MTEMNRPAVDAAAYMQTSNVRRRSAQRHRCTVCRHPEKWRLELLIAGGASVEALARKFNVGPDALGRHWKNHVTPEARQTYLFGPKDLEEIAEKAAREGESIIDYLRIARGSIMTQLATVAIAGDGRTVGYLVGQLTKVLELMAKVTGEVLQLAPGATVNNNTIFINSPAFANLQGLLARELAPYPAALERVVAGLQRLEADEMAIQNGARAATARPAIGHLIEHRQVTG